MRKFYLFFYIFLLFCFQFQFSQAEVVVDKIDGMVDWDKEENYREAKQALAIAKNIRVEAARRKQLRDAGVPDEDIKRIIKQEREAKKDGQKTNGKNSQSSQQSLTKNNGNSNKDDNDDEDNEDDDDESEGKINDYSNDSKLTNVVNNVPKKQEIQTKTAKQPSVVEVSKEEEKKTIMKHQAIVPDVPKVDKQNNDMILAKNSSSNDDWKLSRMLRKAGDNVDNRENFMLFAREVAKIANSTQKTDDFMDIDLLNAETIYEFDNEDDTDFFAKNKSAKRYAYADNVKQQRNSIKNSDNYFKQKSSKKQNNNNKSYGRFYASSKDEYKARIKDEDNSKNYDVMIGKNAMTEKQIAAKNIGVPYPEARTNNDKKTQYQPQNIAQIAYDKNNRHLQPVVFEDHIISQGFEALGGENAVSTARALISKFGKTDITDHDGNTLLMHAIARENQSLVATLLAEGANPNYFNNDGFAPIHLAASNGDNVAMYSIMMYGGNPNLRDKDGNTALMYAAKMCNVDTIKLMLALGGDPTLANASTFRSVLDFAAENENSVVITLMEEKKQNLFRKRKPVELQK